MKHLAIAFLAIVASINCFAKDGKPWHQSAYDMGCKTCHDNGIKAYPSDTSCLKCHDLDDLVEATKRSKDEQWQNPHNNLHYGKDTPCVECHGEHTDDKKPMCMDCHTFKYPNFNG